MSVPEMINLFSLERCHHDGARFDMAKLKSFQEHYLRLKSDAELAALAKPAAEEAGDTVSDSYLQAIAPLMCERIAFAHESR